MNVNKETISGRDYYFATEKVDGKLYQGRGDSEREAKYDLLRVIETAQRNDHYRPKE